MFEDFTQVKLIHPVERQGVRLPRGARGIVLAAYAGGLAYEVEFDEPVHVVLTAEERELCRS